jgi:hypothetical protein
MASFWEKVKKAAATAGVAWSAATTSDNEALEYIKKLDREKRMRIEEQLRRDQEHAAADQVSRAT